ncbi:MAG: CYTH and CHAD domain-containing protein [Propionibacteriales bacterium]|nr:CYTH and CHAD domain-containing protein [Propionibacteriales bacterium]
MTTAIETERKFALAKGQLLPSLEAIATEGPTTQYEQISVYYDTPDLRLTAARQSIRRRTGGPDTGWQAKLPTQNPDERVEVLLPFTSERMPRELRDLVKASVGERPLFPVAEIRTRRTSRELLGPEGAVLAVASADEVVASVGGRSKEWTEAEVELVTGTPALLDAAEAALAAAGVPRSASPSKLAQALAEQVARLEEGSSGESVAELVNGYLAAQVGVLQALELPVIRDEPDAVHRSRVATRRLRCTLRTFEGAFRAVAVRGLREELRWHAEMLGGPRDTEVLTARMIALVDELPSEQADAVRHAVAKAVAGHHGQAHEALVTSMLTDRYRRLQLSLEQLLAAPPLHPMAGESASILLPQMFEQAVARVRHGVARAEARPSDLTRWHEVRKAAKAARYGAEVVAGLHPDQPDPAVAGWTRVTTHLGAVQDAVIGSQFIADVSWIAVQDGASRTPFDELRAREDRNLRESLAAGRAALAEVL